MTPGAPRLRGAFDSPETKRAYARRLFSTIARRYDLITVVLSYGQDRRWKGRLVRLAAPAPGHRALDVACGTGDIALALAARGAAVTGLDFTYDMLALAAAKPSTSRLTLVQGDMMALPFPYASFDIVTAGYGLRNVPELMPALRELRRVLRPGGVCLSLDFDRPEHPLVRAVYLGYLTVVGSTLGWLLHGDADTYRYIPASIRRYPGARRVREALVDAGFARAEHIRVFGGLMGIHRAYA